MSIKPLLPLIDALHQRILTIPQALEQRHQTSAITEELYRWCEREHSALSTEAKIGRIAYKSSGKMRNARVDAFVRTEVGALYAIEVDRTNKTWSVDKLLHCFSQYEAIPVWIRWRGEIVGHLPESIYAVDISPEGYSSDNIRTSFPNTNGADPVECVFRWKRFMGSTFDEVGGPPN